MSSTKVIVFGSLNTDIVVSGIEQFPQPGHHTYGKDLTIAAGGKSRNVAHMTGELLGQGTVAMIGVTAQDQYGMWKIPIDALDSVGVSTEYVTQLEGTDKLPGVAIVVVNTKGENEIFVIPGVNHDLNETHVDKAQKLFEKVGKDNGYLCLSLEAPANIIAYAAKKGDEHGVKVILDPGGVKLNVDYSALLNDRLFLIKPNEHETKILTGVEVTDMESALEAAQFFQDKGIENVLITVGSKGAYLVTPNEQLHLPIPNLDIPDAAKDETGCGDQALAGLVASLAEGDDIVSAAKKAVIAGTLQFYKPGVTPITKKEFEKYTIGTI